MKSIVARCQGAFYSNTCTSLTLESSPSRSPRCATAWIAKRLHQQLIKMKCRLDNLAASVSLSRDFHLRESTPKSDPNVPATFVPKTYVPMKIESVYSLPRHFRSERLSERPFHLRKPTPKSRLRSGTHNGLLTYRISPAASALPPAPCSPWRSRTRPSRTCRSRCSPAAGSTGRTHPHSTRLHSKLQSGQTG